MFLSRVSMSSVLCPCISTQKHFYWLSSPKFWRFQTRFHQLLRLFPFENETLLCITTDIVSLGARCSPALSSLAIEALSSPSFSFFHPDITSRIPFQLLSPLFSVTRCSLFHVHSGSEKTYIVLIFPFVHWLNDSCGSVLSPSLSPFVLHPIKKELLLVLKTALFSLTVLHESIQANDR